MSPASGQPHRFPFAPERHPHLALLQPASKTEAANIPCSSAKQVRVVPKPHKDRFVRKRKHDSLIGKKNIRQDKRKNGKDRFRLTSDETHSLPPCACNPSGTQLQKPHTGFSFPVRSTEGTLYRVTLTGRCPLSCHIISPIRQLSSRQPVITCLRTGRQFAALAAPPALPAPAAGSILPAATCQTRFKPLQRPAPFIPPPAPPGFRPPYHSRQRSTRLPSKRETPAALVIKEDVLRAGGDSSANKMPGSGDL